MSIASYLVCPSRRLMLPLGKRLRAPDGTVIGYSIGNHRSSEDVERTQALWKFLADTAGEQLVVTFSDDAEFEEIATYAVIGGDCEADGDMPFDVYLGSETAP